jgi:hypothetical protein
MKRVLRLSRALCPLKDDCVHWLRLVAPVSGLAVAAFVQATDAGIEAAQQLFGRYVALAQAHDAGVAELYADDAVIKSRRKPPMGDAREVTVPAPEYKTLLRQQMVAGDAGGGRGTYSAVSYDGEGEFVRINAVWRGQPSQRATPISLLVGRSPSGRWLIYEETFETPPWER